MVDNPNITWLQLPNGVMLHLINSPEAPARPEHVHHAFEVGDFDATTRALPEKDMSIQRAGVPHDDQRYLCLRHPDGNRVE
jgi:hypothetical protein